MEAGNDRATANHIEEKHLIAKHYPPKKAI